MRLLAVALLLASSDAGAQNQTIDYPGATDWSTVTRPTGSIISGSSHVDRDEFAVPISRYFNSKFTTTATATGPVDYLAYSGPPTTSTLQNYVSISSQLISAGYKQVFTCVREACNSAAFAFAFRDPLMRALGGTGYHNITLESLGAASGDMRYGAFQKGSQYICILVVLNTGRRSGALLVRAGD